MPQHVLRVHKENQNNSNRNVTLLKFFLETKLIKHFHGKRKKKFSKTEFCFFLSLYNIKWIIGYCGAKDAYHLLFKS